jgi:hypothetical protein
MDLHNYTISSYNLQRRPCVEDYDLISRLTTKLRTIFTVSNGILAILPINYQNILSLFIDS